MEQTAPFAPYRTLNIQQQTPTETNPEPELEADTERSRVGNRQTSPNRYL